MARKDEQPICNVLNKILNTKFELVEDEFSRFDAEDENYLLEIKVRHKDYGDMVMDLEKCTAIKRAAAAKGKIPLFCITTPTGWKVIDLREKYRVIQRMSPKTTDFKNKEKVLKKFANWKRGWMDISLNKVESVRDSLRYEQ
jgi:hypothetical protein